jgi:hypothetical protein
MAHGDESTHDKGKVCAKGDRTPLRMIFRRRACALLARRAER